MRYWKGSWLMGVAVIHTGFALAVFGDELRGVVARGVFDSVGTDPMVGTVVWFVLFGAMLFVCGLAVAALEHATLGELPRSLGWSLAALATLGVVLMPASGFWLAYPPAIAILARKAW
jgi:uncharacterized membrane protein YccF (DUF307 family)